MHHGGGGGAIRVLNVAEKPSVAKSVAEILSRPSGGMRSREGRSRYNRVFEFDYSIGGRACHMLVTSVTGHLMELEFDDRFRRWHSCDPADLFHAPVRKSVPQVRLSVSCYPFLRTVGAQRAVSCELCPHQSRVVFCMVWSLSVLRPWSWLCLTHGEMCGTEISLTSLCSCVWWCTVPGFQFVGA